MHRQDLIATLSSRTFLTFGGTETWMSFVQGYPLREFCAFEVAADELAWDVLEQGLLRPILDAGAATGLGVIADCLVWRASTDYVNRLGHGELGVSGVNRLAVARTRRLVDEWRARGGDAERDCPVILAGDLGPRGDGYTIGSGGTVSIPAARDYHLAQLEALADAGVDLVTALTMTSPAETIGIVRAAEQVGLPVVVSPTTETDGRLPDGTPLGEFVMEVDDGTSGAPLAYMANCVHPLHLAPVLEEAADKGAPWLSRFRGLRANASTRSHAELDCSTSLDRGDPEDLARRMAALHHLYGFTIVGGCCGTDAEHLRAMAQQLST